MPERCSASLPLPAQAHQVNLSTARVELLPDRTVSVVVGLKGSDADAPRRHADFRRWVECRRSSKGRGVDRSDCCLRERACRRDRHRWTATGMALSDNPRGEAVSSSLSLQRHCSSTRVLCRMINLIRDRCLIVLANTSRALPRMLPAYSRRSTFASSLVALPALPWRFDSRAIDEAAHSTVQNSNPSGLI